MTSLASGGCLYPNPIENAGQYRKTTDPEAQPTSAETMEETLKKKWISLDSQNCHTLVRSMPSRPQRVLEVKVDMTRQPSDASDVI